MSVKWANNKGNPMTSSVVFNENAPPVNVGMDQYLSNAVKLRPQIPKSKRNATGNGQRKNRVVLQYCNTLPVSTTTSFVQSPEMQRQHEQCKLLMKQRRDKQSAKGKPSRRRTRRA
jgi:hypothetical protein